eukprot:6830372-Karenia_brevis.AAC.1
MVGVLTQLLQQQQSTIANLQQGATTASQSSQGVVDTRALGKPDSFKGEDAAWKDWSIVMRSYTSLVEPRLGPLMEAAEESDTPCLLASVVEAADCMACTELYNILLM